MCIVWQTAESSLGNSLWDILDLKEEIYLTVLLMVAMTHSNLKSKKDELFSVT